MLKAEGEWITMLFPPNWVASFFMSLTADMSNSLFVIKKKVYQWPSLPVTVPTGVQSVIELSSKYKKTLSIFVFSTLVVDAQPESSDSNIKEHKAVFILCIQIK